MKMLLMICCRTLGDCISNETICEMVGVELFERSEVAIVWHMEKMVDEAAPVKANL